MPVSVFSDLEKCAQVGEVNSEAVCICVQKPEKNNSYGRHDEMIKNDHWLELRTIINECTKQTWMQRTVISENWEQLDLLNSYEF